MSGVVAGDKLTAAELCERLEISAAKLRELVKAGLPCEGTGRNRSFDLDAVDSWLLANNLAEVETDSPAVAATVATTRAEAARLLGLNGVDGERTIGRWLLQPGFPGRAGRPGKQDGYFPIEEIKAWREKNGARGGVAADEELIAAKKRLALLEIQEQELAAKERLGHLLDFGDVSTFYESCVVNTKAVLGQIQDEVLAILPADIGDDIRTQIYRRVQRRIDDACAEISQLMVGDTDPTGDEEEETTDQ